MSRYGHTAVQWEDRVLCFGGCTASGFTNTLAILSVKETVGTWMDLENEGPKGAVPKARAFHSSTVTEKYMLVYAGQDEQGTLLQDVSALHLPSMTWTKPQVDSKP